jgi:hypothetical protein
MPCIGYLALGAKAKLSYSVEQIMPEAFTLVASMVVTIPMIIVIALLIAVLHGRLCGYGTPRNRTLNNLVQFPTIKPNTSALWAIVNLDALSVAHYKIDRMTDRTLHVHLLMFMEMLDNRTPMLSKP